jgi:hypothetical protein
MQEDKQVLESTSNLEVFKQLFSKEEDPSPELLHIHTALGNTLICLYLLENGLARINPRISME